MALDPMKLFVLAEQNCRELRNMWQMCEEGGPEYAEKAVEAFEAMEKAMRLRLKNLDVMREVVPDIPDVDDADRQFGISDFNHAEKIAAIFDQEP